MTSTTATIPGAGLSYTDLCDTGFGPERTMWSAMGTLADILGVTQHVGSIAPRTKTVDEYLSVLRESLGDDWTDAEIAAAALAAKAMTTDAPRFEERFEIRRLVPDEKMGSMKFIVDETFDDYEEAVARKAEYDATIDGILAIVAVQVTTSADVYPKDYVRRL